ncbi:recombinase family protein [Paenibacillus oryzisoli]|uniref:Resolvase n=1 Tax=Paenibacillus oryzisoli TaxID=1850517 RepID=A0A198AE09_9BACL|nr:recombinase family protein [Paenibacillus oryzisoli]OAS19291.1 hypothetical protein A8708_26645 [Paenibacillus oryzisoli]
MRAALYLRVSTEEQSRDGYSIAAQKDRLTAYTHSQEWDIVDYYVDEGFSAKDTNRPDLQRLINDVKQKKIDVVLVHKLDRFTRSVKDLYALLDEFEKYKCGFRSAQEQFDTTTPMGRAMMGMLGIFAQWEREVIAERVYVGMEQKHISGERNGAVAPMGYDLVDGSLVVNPERAEFVKRLFAMYTDNNGIYKMQQILSSEGITMNARTIYYILSNPIYCGMIRWNYRKDGKLTGNEDVRHPEKRKHEPIISEEEFNRVQSIRGVRAKQGRAATSDFPFTGVMKCSRCGYAMVGASRKQKGATRRFYRCSGRVSYGKCDMPPISEKSVDRAFLKSLRIPKRELIKKIVMPPQNKEKKSDADAIERELTAIANRKRKWQIAFANDAITLEELKAHTDDDKRRELDLKKQLNEIPQSNRKVYSKEEIIEQLVLVQNVWEELEDHYAKKMFLQELFESIILHTDTTSPRPGKNNDFEVVISSWILK